MSTAAEHQETIEMLGRCMQHCGLPLQSVDLTCAQQAEITERGPGLAWTEQTAPLGDHGVEGHHPLPRAEADNDLEAALARARAGIAV